MNCPHLLPPFLSPPFMQAAPPPSEGDLQWQADHYEAVLRAVRGAHEEGWFQGIFFWSWNTDPAGSTSKGCITPQGKPAEGVVRRLWGGGRGGNVSVVGDEADAGGEEEEAVCVCTV